MLGAREGSPRALIPTSVLAIHNVIAKNYGCQYKVVIMHGIN